ncbi:MAG: response regulator, partial [Pseudomonadota bacterium]
MTLRALFVDDEPMVLNGLRRMLRSLRGDWDMDFATSGKEALAKMSDGGFTVIVSDMRMPEMDGAALLDEVAVRHPET